MRWYFDTSVIVAAAIEGHERNGITLAVLEELARDRHHGVVSAHTIAELYSVVTKLPSPLGLSPAQAKAVVESLILNRMEIITLTRSDYEIAMKRCSEANWISGRIYDAIHIQCALKAQCERIYTLDARDFRVLCPEGIQTRLVVL